MAAVWPFPPIEKSRTTTPKPVMIYLAGEPQFALAPMRARISTMSRPRQIAGTYHRS